MEGELDEDENQFSNSFREDVVDIENERIRRNPQSYFALKKTGSFGYGLFARHFVKKGFELFMLFKMFKMKIVSADRAKHNTKNS